MATPDYVLIEDHTVLKDDQWNKLVIPAGTFVRPIEKTYLPQHVKDSVEYKYHLPMIDIFVYSRYGIFPIPKRKVRRI